MSGDFGRFLDGQCKIIANSANNTQRLAVVKAGLETLEKSRRAGLVTEAGAISQINALTRQRESLERSITAEANQRAHETASLELQAAETNLQVLQAKKADGAKNDQEIKEAQKQIFQQKLDLLEQEKQAAVDAAQGEQSAIEAINQQYALKREGLLTQETLARKAAADQQTQAVDQALTQQEQRFQQFADRIGGPNSPIQSISEAFSSPGSFSFGSAFSLNDQLKKVAAAGVNSVNKYDRVKQQVQADANEPNAQAQDLTRRVNGGGGSDGGQGSGGGGSGRRSNDVDRQVGETRISAIINVNNDKFGAADKDIEDLVITVLERVARRRKQ